MKKRLIFPCIVTILISPRGFAQEIPKGFASIASVVPTVAIEMRYSTTENFMGRVVAGYQQPKAVLTQPTLAALQKAQAKFKTYGLGIKLFDGYRPQKAVNDFVKWSKNPADTIHKKQYYPNTRKAVLFELGYIAKRSGHSRGSTVDITLVYLEGEQKGKEVDMGGPWDFFGPISWIESGLISPQQKVNRQLLQSIMKASGFRSYSKEWWHFTLVNEPYPDTYFDF